MDTKRIARTASITLACTIALAATGHSASAQDNGPGGGPKGCAISGITPLPEGLGTDTVPTGTVLPTPSGYLGPGTYLCVNGQWILTVPMDPITGVLLSSTGPATSTGPGWLVHLRRPDVISTTTLTVTVQPSQPKAGLPVTYVVTTR